MKHEDQTSVEENTEMDNENTMDRVDGLVEPGLEGVSEETLSTEEGSHLFAEDTEAEEAEVEGTELEDFEPAEIIAEEFIDTDHVVSIVESILFSTDKPQSIGVIKQAFKGTNVKSKDIKKAIETLMTEYASPERGVTLEEVTGGYQLRTKPDNMDYLRRMVKTRPFKLSGPALEVLAIVTYKQPCAKLHVDEIRGVESGHLLRGLMDKGIVAFAGKSDLPGKPMLYQTTRKFLEIFGLRNLQELPNLAEIDELLPEGIEPEEIEKKETLDSVADSLQQDAVVSYSASADELEKITTQLSDISTSSEFFEQEKLREKQRREKERAQDIRESLEFGEEVSTKDQRWLERYEQALLEEEQKNQELAAIENTESVEAAPSEESTGDETESSNDTVVAKAELDSSESLQDAEVVAEDESEVLFSGEAVQAVIEAEGNAEIDNVVMDPTCETEPVTDKDL